MRTKIILAASLFALSACGGGAAGNEGAGNAGAGANPPAATPPGQPPADISVSTSQGKAEIRTGAGAVANWPDGVPAYPGAQANQNVNVSGAAAGRGGSILGFQTADTPQQVIAFYSREIVRNGFTIANQMDMGATATVTARRGQGEAINITATRTGAVTQVQIIAPTAG